MNRHDTHVAIIIPRDDIFIAAGIRSAAGSRRRRGRLSAGSRRCPHRAADRSSRCRQLFLIRLLLLVKCLLVIVKAALFIIQSFPDLICLVFCLFLQRSDLILRLDGLRDQTVLRFGELKVAVRALLQHSFIRRGNCLRRL